MAWREIIYQYDGSFEGLLCCVFESYTKKERPTAILRDGDDEPSLFEIRAVTTDRAHAQRIYRSLYKRSPEVGPFLRRAFLTCLPDKEMAIYRFIVKFYREGAPLLSRLSDDTYLPLLKAVRQLSGEVEQFRGFTRFSDFDGVLGAEIEPKNRVLPVLRRHFCERYHNETFFLYDRTHREALLYSGGVSRIVPLNHFEMAQPDEVEAGYRRLWRRFYDTVAIEARKNEKLRMTHMPKRYWGMMTEFQDESYFKARPKETPSASPAPGACSCVSPLKKRSRIVIFSRSGSSSMASRSAMRSMSPSSGDSPPSIPSSVSPLPVSRCKLSGAATASSHCAISSALNPVSSESSESAGSRPSVFLSFSRAAKIVAACSRMLRLTLIAPSSRRKRRISPAIFGTA